MYLRGSRWRVTQKTRRPNWWLIFFLLLAIAGMLYINQVVVPATPPLFIPTPTVTLSPEAFINQAQELFTAGKLEASRQAYKEAIAADPENSANFVELARVEVFSGMYADAVVNAQNALLKNPNNPLAHATLGWAYGFQDLYGEAERSIRRSLEIDPNNALAHAYYAELLINQLDQDYGLLDKAISESKLAVDLAPELLETHRVRGIVLYNTGNLEEAVLEFEKAISINKNIADLHLYLGISYRALERYDLAEESLLLAYSLNPQDTVALVELARAYFADGRYAQASQYAEEAVKLDPANPHRHGYLGITYYKQEMYEEANREFELAVRGGTLTVNSTDAAGKSVLSDVEVQAIPLTYEDRAMQYYWYYGFSLVRANRCDTAVAIFQSLLTEVPDNEIAVYNAQEGLNMCKELIKTPQPTVEGAGQETETPEPTAAP